MFDSSAVVLVSFCSVYVLNQAVLGSTGRQRSGPGDSWLVRLLANVLNYSTVLVPGYLAYRYIRSTRYLEQAGEGCFPRLVRLCVGQDPEGAQGGPEGGTPQGSVPAPARSSLHRAALLLLCFLGLQLSYLSWGVLQEKVMTQVLAITTFISIHKIQTVVFS